VAVIYLGHGVVFFCIIYSHFADLCNGIGCPLAKSRKLTHFSGPSQKYMFGLGPIVLEVLSTRVYPRGIFEFK